MKQPKIDAIADVIWFLKGMRQSSEMNFPITSYHIDCLSLARQELMDANEAEESKPQCKPSSPF